MGCVKSKEDKGPSLKYRPDASNPTAAPSHMGHYGPDPTQMGQSPALKGPNSSYNSHATTITPFGGSSATITPFGGAASSFSTVAVNNPFPGGVTGGWLRIVIFHVRPCEKLLETVNSTPLYCFMKHVVLSCDTTVYISCHF